MAIEERALERYMGAIRAVSQLHTFRSRDVDGATLRWCVECQQSWPCATEKAVRAALGTDSD